MVSALPIYVTNTVGRKLELFEPIEPGKVRLYTCGPTVYSHIHVGNFRSFLFADTLRRMLEYNGYKVVHARNITDVGHLTDETLNTGLDRIEAAARRENMSPWDIVRHFTSLFLEDARALNLEEPTYLPRATEFIPQMIELTQRLIDRGYGYVADDNVYYDVSKFPRYGELSGNSVQELIAGHRVEVGEGKHSPADFALWKAAAPDRIMRWESPWGEGVPGWHIECSAMSMSLLGEQIDIHTGGVDNMFPHHEDEIAQSEAATGKTFSRYWMHSAWLVEQGGEKMARSVGNFYTLTDLAERGIHPLSYRYFTFQAHYRTPLTFSWEALEAAQTALVRIWESVAELLQASEAEELGPEAEAYRERFRKAINRDLDMPGALAVLHDALGSRLPPGQKLGLLVNFDSVLALDLAATGRAMSETSSAEQELLARRQTARQERDWALSDALRSQLSESGLEVKDTAGGQRWVRKDFLARWRDSSRHKTRQEAGH